MLVFGGGQYGVVYYSDTWQLSLVAGSEEWTELLPGVSPLARGQHTTAFDADRGRMVIFSGLNIIPIGGTLMNDVWAFDGNNWNNLFPSGIRPVSRRGAHSCYDAMNDRLVVFGGQRLPVYERYTDALVNIVPDTLNLNPRIRAPWITCYITLPDGYDVNTVDVSTIGIIKINQYVISPPLVCDQEVGGVMGDYDEDGIPDLTVKFDRQALISMLLIGDAGITIEGYLSTGIYFTGSDTIRVIQRGKP
jgi:hypothetical protein